MSRMFEELRGNAEGLLYTTEKSLDEYGHVFEDEQVNMLRAAQARVRAALALTDAAVLLDAVRALDVLSRRMAEELYRDAERHLGPLGRIAPAFAHLNLHITLENILVYLLRRVSEERQVPLPIAAVVDRELGLASLDVDRADVSDVDDLTDGIVEGLRAGAARGQYLATGTCTLAAGEEGEAEALLISLDHEDGTSLIVTVTFAMRDDAFVWGRVTTDEGAHAVFPLPS
jgi:hypothetical protein